MSSQDTKELENYRKILVVKLGALGDFVQASGAFKRLREVHKSAHITLLTSKPYVGLGEACGYFDDVVIDVRPKFYQLGKLFTLRRFFRDSGFERIYDMQNNDRTSSYFRCFGLKNHCEWVGAVRGASHQDRNPNRGVIHVFDMLRETLKVGGVEDVCVDPLLWMDGDVSAFDLKDPYIVLVPGCAPTRLMKRWPAEHYIDLAKRMQAKGYNIVVIGTNAEADITQQISSSCSGVLNLTGETSLSQIVSLGRGAAGAVGNDTGPVHFLGPSGCPLLVLYPGVSNPERFSTLGNHVRTIQKDVIGDISVDEAEAALSDLLEG